MRSYWVGAALIQRLVSLQEEKQRQGNIPVMVEAEFRAICLHAKECQALLQQLGTERKA